jgi:hypothetical protein
VQHLHRVARQVERGQSSGDEDEIHFINNKFVILEIC